MVVVNMRMDGGREGSRTTVETVMLYLGRRYGRKAVALGLQS